jgi:anti-sigma regulatory factor (Ser/Thr protein kinase)
MMDNGRVEVALRIPPAVDAPMRARAEVVSLGVPRPTIDDITLLVSELVTNCVIHADLAPGQDIHLHFTRDPGTVRVEVRDEGRGFADSLLRGAHSSGFGLFLVEQIADRWGVERGEQTCVWFEVDVPETEFRPPPP